MRERKYWIDYLKVIAIYLVILGHLPDELHIKWGIYLFHMPLKSKSNEKSNHHVCPRYGHHNCQRAGECNR